MRIIVTGAGGFVGRHVLAELSEHDVVALDTDLRHIPDLRHVTKVEGDIQKSSSLVEAFKQGCDAVIHLATVPGGAAEANPSLAQSVNVDATVAVIEKAIATGDCPRFVFASSIAVFGKLPLRLVVDAAPTQPTMRYGEHKLIMERWIATQSRGGVIEGLSLRLPGVVARPKSPSGMKSAFLSDMFHALRENRGFTVPVSQAATTWLCSVKTAAMNLAIATTKNNIATPDYSPILAPALQVNIVELEQEIRRQLGSTSIVNYSRDDSLQSLFGEHPEVKTPLAQSLGFIKDVDLAHLVRSAL